MKHLISALLLASLALSMPATAVPTADQINLDIGTPPVIAVKHQMAQRYSRLVKFYEPGVMGLGSDGMVKLRDTSRLNPTLLKIAEKLIDQENPDRNSLIYAVAESYGGKEAVPVVRELLVKRWKDQFKSGWWMEDEKGNWYQKP
ncbi:MAG: DUF1318 domain-containing protein [Betaproteobacteria bacterium]|uniref:DUF1318 domain-containing protein n=1 Tax=Candidatus Proximibacter danicus TaxID=2954365 RepID=A0A9D7K2E2_9PROT|nr:DUF1318 domain-containing protein [Candidatus Proximibacter danicus]